MSERELVVEYMAQAPEGLEPAQVVKFLEHGRPEREVFPESGQWEVDLVAAADGAVGPGILLRDLEGAPMGAKLLDANEGIELGRLVLTNSYLILRRLAEAGQEWAEEAIRRHLMAVIRTTLPELLEEIKANAMLRAHGELMEAEDARRLVIEREERERVRRREREKILELARAAATLDAGDRSRRLHDLKPWLAEVAAGEKD